MHFPPNLLLCREEKDIFRISVSCPPPTEMSPLPPPPLPACPFLPRGRGLSPFPRNTLSLHFCSPLPLSSVGCWSISTFITSSFCSPYKNVQIFLIYLLCTRRYAKCWVCMCQYKTFIYCFIWFSQPPCKAANINPMLQGGIQGTEEGSQVPQQASQWVEGSAC